MSNNTQEKPSNPTEASNNEKKEDSGSFFVDPNTARGDIDYDKLLSNFECEGIASSTLERLTKLTGYEAHPMLRRGVFYGQRDLDKILDCYQAGKPFYLYTVRSPNGESMHIGHMVSFSMNRYLQRVFNAPLIIQIADDDTFLQQKTESDMTLEEATKMARNCVKDIISFGFDITKTFIFLNTNYIFNLYPMVCQLQSKLTFNDITPIFEYKKTEDVGSTSCGKLALPAYQIASTFACSFEALFGKQFSKNKNEMRCLVTCGIDKDPYFNLGRNVASDIGQLACSNLYSKFLPSLLNPNEKMSFENQVGCIFLNESAKKIEKKIMKYAFSGGGDTKELHEKHGANLAKDVSFQYLTCFMENEKQLNEIAQKYQSGSMLTSQVKKAACQVLIEKINKFQENRKAVTDEMIDAFMTVRLLN